MFNYFIIIIQKKFGTQDFPSLMTFESEHFVNFQIKECPNKNGKSVNIYDQLTIFNQLNNIIWFINEEYFKDVCSI